jgi:hypothetical protein
MIFSHIYIQNSIFSIYAEFIFLLMKNNNFFKMGGWNLIYNTKFSSVIRNSKNKFYRFYINQNKNLIIEEYNSTGLMNNIIFKQSIVDYSVDIDQNDIIHILFLSSDGNLRYSVYPQNYQDKILATFDLQNNYVSFLSLKLLLLDIHVFYMVRSKLSSLKLTIFHNMWHKSKWTSQKISDITSVKYAYPFFIDYDSKKNLYVFFSKNCTDFFSIKKYSTEFNIWVDFDDSLTIENVNNVSFFIADNDIAIISYNQSINKNIQTFIKYKDLVNINSSWSSPILISNTNSIRPSVFTKDNHIYIMWEDGYNIVYRKTSDINLNWSEKKFLTFKNDNIINAVYRSNNYIDSSFKNSYVYLTINPFPNPIINEENTYNESNNYSTKNNHNNVHSNQHSNTAPYSNPMESNNNSLNNIYLNQIPTKVSYSNSMANNKGNDYLANYLDIISKKDKEIEVFTKTTLELSQQLNNLSKQYCEKDLAIQQLNSELSELGLKYNNDIKECNMIIEMLREENKMFHNENYSYIEETNKNFYILNLLLKETNTSIKKLSEITTLANQELNSKISALESLHRNKNKSFFKFFKFKK